MNSLLYYSVINVGVVCTKLVTTQYTATSRGYWATNRAPVVDKGEVRARELRRSVVTLCTSCVARLTSNLSSWPTIVAVKALRSRDALRFPSVLIAIHRAISKSQAGPANVLSSWKCSQRLVELCDTLRLVATPQRFHWDALRWRRCTWRSGHF